MEARSQHRSCPLVETWFLTAIWGLMIRLAGQQVPGVLPTLLSLFLDYKHALSHQASHMGAGNGTQVFVLMWQVLTKPPSRPLL